MHASKAVWLPQIYEAARVPAVAFDPAGRVVCINAQAEALFSVTSQEIIGCTIAQLGSVLPEAPRGAVARLLSGEVDGTGEAELRDERFVYMTGWTAGPERVAFLLLYPSPASPHDPSSDFLSLASHELKTPLTAIKGAAQLFERRIARGATPLGEREAQLLGMVSSQVNKLTGVVDALLEASRIAGGNVELSLEVGDLRETLQTAVESFSASSGGASVEFSPMPMPVVARYDRRRVIQILNELLRNARVAAAGSPITVSASIVQGEKACVCVADTGPGIPPAEQPHVFDRFYKGSSLEHGLGLGLYIASELTRMQGGRMWFDSREGKGSNFYFTLPGA